MQRQRLNELNALFLKFTDRPGVLKALKPEEDWSGARGLHFECPLCQYEDNGRKAHGLTFLFDHPEVPKRAKPVGRWRNIPGPLHNLSMEGMLFSQTCRWKGIVSYGEVRWK